MGAQGRTVHTAATRELGALTKEAQGVVRAMDARNRLRFEGDRQALELWVSARAVLGSPTGGEGEGRRRGRRGRRDAGGGAAGAGRRTTGGDVRPAA